MKVKELVAKLDELVPFDTADPWDNPGMSVGNPEYDIRGIACALDAIPQTIHEAADSGANVLVTHHPIFLQAPNPITDGISSSSLEGTAVWRTVRNHMAVISLHTNLDKSDIAQEYLASLLGFDYLGHMEEPASFGALLDTKGMELEALARHCGRITATQPIVWGLAESKQINKAVYCSGSCGDLGSLAIKRGDIDCVICGECGYHKLLEMDEAGVAVILLGHDASEKPFAGLLADLVLKVAPDICIEVLDEPKRWQALA